MNKISSTDNQIDKVVDKQLDNPIIEFTPTTKKSRVFSIPYTGPVYEPIPPVGLPNIVVATAEVIEITNYELLNGIYIRIYDINFGYYYVREDAEYDIFWSFALGGVSSNWSITFLGDYTTVATYVNIGNDILPAEGWFIEGVTYQPLPLQITAIG
jgi:hypothetical protein